MVASSNFGFGSKETVSVTLAMFEQQSFYQFLNAVAANPGQSLHWLLLSVFELSIDFAPRFIGFNK